MSAIRSLVFNLYQTNNNSLRGEGKMILSGPDNGGYYTAQIEELHILGDPPSEPEELKGQARDCDGILQISLFESQRDDIKMLLIRNPFEERVSYSGSMSLRTNVDLVFNLSAIVV